MMPKLIVHGGAWNIPERLHQAHTEGCLTAIQQVYPELEKGLSALDAVEKAVNILEEDPTFDAGRGSFLNAIGEVELDAIICDGRNLNYGAVAAIQNILYPVSSARIVMEKSEHCFLVGPGAQQFLIENGVKPVKTEDLLTRRELLFYNRIKSDPKFTTRKPFEPFPKGTVGAVALDTNGNLAAATSTGGTPRKLPGRVGDSPVIGAGAYADNQLGAVSATGFGEPILKVLLSKTVCDAFSRLEAEEAAQFGVELMKERVDGLGGVVGIRKDGSYAYYHNTEYMAYACFDNKTGFVSKIKCDAA
jgi:beta-aspartyl-peptidase (threonine type)